jgi:hypothetical protein
MRAKVITFCVLSAALASTAQGQDFEAKVTWDAPSFFNPRPMDDIGLYFTSIERANSGSATGLAAIWRQSGNLNLGIRLGTFDLEDIGNSLAVGAELYGPLSLFSGSQLDLAWTLGAGAVFGDDYTVGTIPLGVSLGLRLGSGSIRIEPYVHPRAALDIIAIGEGDNEETDTDVAFVLDLGADVNIGERFILRLGGSLLDREAFGAGIAYRWPRPISVVGRNQ